MGRTLKYVKKEQREREKYIEGFERRDMQTRRGLESADQSVLLHRSTTELCLLFAISFIFFSFFFFFFFFFSFFFLFFFSYSFFFLVFFCLSNLTRINCGIALNYLLSKRGHPCLVVSLLCKIRNKAQISKFVVGRKYKILYPCPKYIFLTTFLDVKHL